MMKRRHEDEQSKVESRQARNYGVMYVGSCDLEEVYWKVSDIFDLYPAFSPYSNPKVGYDIKITHLATQH